MSQLVGLFLSAELRAELSGPGQIVLYQPDLHISPPFLFLHVPVCGYLGLSSKILCCGFQIRELDTRIILAAGGSLIPFLLVYWGPTRRRDDQLGGSLISLIRSGGIPWVGDDLGLFWPIRRVIPAHQISRNPVQR